MKHVCVKHNLQYYYLQKYISDFFFKCHVLLRNGFAMMFIRSPQEISVLCRKCGLQITNESSLAFWSSICLDCIFINDCAAIVCV